MLIDFKYLFDKYKINCTGLLHCGASYVQERDMYEQLNIPKVIWVEAIKRVFNKAVDILYPYQNQIIINACIGDEDGKEVVFHISNNEAQSSSYLELGHHAIIHPSVCYVEDIPMETVRLDTLLNSYDISGINFGNLDLQGIELSALHSLGKLINQFDYFYLEINKKYTYKDCALVDEVDNFLSDFERVETGTWVGDCWTDCLYIRKSIL